VATCTQALVDNAQKLKQWLRIALNELPSKEAEPRRPQDWAYKLTDIECTNKQRHSQAELKPRGFKFVPLRQKDKISWTEAGHRSEHILL